MKKKSQRNKRNIKNKNKPGNKEIKIEIEDNLTKINELKELPIDINLEGLNKTINKDLDEDESKEFKFTKYRKYILMNVWRKS